MFCENIYFIVNCMKQTLVKYLKIAMQQAMFFVKNSRSIKKFVIGISISSIVAALFAGVYFLVLVPKMSLEGGAFSTSAEGENGQEQTNIEKISKELEIKPNDITEGDPSAPITIVSYDSFTCGHCAFFYTNTYKIIKQNYIDRKIIKFVHRNFATDAASIDVSHLLECYSTQIANGDVARRFAMVQSLYASQNAWIGEGYVENVSKYFKMGGMSEQQIKTCLFNDPAAQASNEASKSTYIQQKIEEIRRISSILGILGTPTIFVNGVKNEDKNSPEVLSKLIEEEYKNYKLSINNDVNLDGGTGDESNMPTQA